MKAKAVKTSKVVEAPVTAEIATEPVALVDTLPKVPTVTAAVAPSGAVAADVVRGPLIDSALIGSKRVVGPCCQRLVRGISDPCIFRSSCNPKVAGIANRGLVGSRILPNRLYASGILPAGDFIDEAIIPEPIAPRRVLTPSRRILTPRRVLTPNRRVFANPGVVMSDLDVVEPGLVGSGVVAPGLVGSGVVAPGLVEDVVGANVVAPGVVPSRVVPSGVVKSRVVAPGVVPDVVAPGLVPDYVAPGVVAPGLVPDYVAPGVVAPGLVSDYVAPGLVAGNGIVYDNFGGVVRRNVVKARRCGSPLVSRRVVGAPYVDYGYDCGLVGPYPHCFGFDPYGCYGYDAYGYGVLP